MHTSLNKENSFVLTYKLIGWIWHTLIFQIKNIVNRALKTGYTNLVAVIMFGFIYLSLCIPIPDDAVNYTFVLLLGVLKQF